MRLGYTTMMAAAAWLIATGCGSAPPPAAAPPKPPAAAITQFYASPGTVGRGGRSLLCYGVEAAAAVKIDPPVEELTPSLARCVEVKPAETTTYKLVAANRAGEEVTQTVTVTVDPKLRAGEAGTPKRSGQGTLIQFFTAVQTTVPKGMPVTFCYGVKARPRYR